MYSIEILPEHVQQFMDAHAAYEASLPKTELRVFVPHINGTEYDSILSCCKQLKDAGYVAVAHLAVRNLRKVDSLHGIADGINALGLTELLVLGGDNDQAEQFESVIDFLRTDVLQSTTIKQLYFSTFADGHPHVDDDREAIAMVKEKVDWAKAKGLPVGLLTQLCFESPMMLNHINQLQEAGVMSEVSAGFVAPCKFTKLIRVAALVGLKNAMSFVKKNNVLKLLKDYDSDTYIHPLMASGKTGSTHAYPFGNYDGALQKLALYHAS